MGLPATGVVGHVGPSRVASLLLRYYIWAVVATDTTLTAVARARTPTWDERLTPDSPRTRQLVNQRQLRLPSPQHPLHQRAVILTLRPGFVIYSVIGQNILHFTYSVNYSKM